MYESPDRLLSRSQVEEILSIKRTTLYRMAISGELVPRKVHRRLGYLESEVQQFLKSLPAVNGKLLGCATNQGPVNG